MASDSDDDITARDQQSDDNAPTGPAQPISQSEIADLLYGLADRDERLEQLRRYRKRLQAQGAAEIAEGDAAGLLAEVERAIGTVEADASGPQVEARADVDPLAHRETLSPDDDDLLDLEAIENDDDLGDLRALDGANDEDDGASR